MIEKTLSLMTYYTKDQHTSGAGISICEPSMTPTTLGSCEIF